MTVESAPVSLEQIKSKVGSDPHDICSEIENSVEEPKERVRLKFESFDDNPCYGNLMYVSHEYRHGDIEIREDILSRFERYLAFASLEISDQISYTLWCDYFESPEWVENVFNFLVNKETKPTVLRRLLPHLGPVPWRYKRLLISSLVVRKKYHVLIFECLLHSQFDVFGSIDSGEALKFLEMLDISPKTKHLSTLKEKMVEQIKRDELKVRSQKPKTKKTSRRGN